MVWVGLILSVEGLNRTKRQTLFEERILQQTASELPLQHGSFLCKDL